MTYTMTPRVYFHDTVAPLDPIVTGDWIEITEHVRNLDFAHGRSKGADDFQPGNGSMTLDNRDSLFDPSNEDSPYYPSLKLRRRIRVDAYIENNGTPFAAPTIAYGYVEQWPQTWNYRYLVNVEVTWTDALGVLANHDMPDSVWDYAIKQHCEAGRVVVWHRWGDGNSTAIDSSGNEYHGRYVVSDSGLDPVTLGTPAPKPVVKDGEVDSIIPQVFRPALSVGKMVAETGQPSSSTPAGWRFPSVVCHPATSLWGTEFTVEMWVQYRSAFSLDDAGGPSALTPRDQYVAFWGNPNGDASAFVLYRDPLDPTIQPAALTAISSSGGSWAFSHIGQVVTGTLSTPQLDDGLPHHLVWRVVDGGASWSISPFIDGVATGTSTAFNKAGSALGYSRPMEIGRQFASPLGANFDGGFASTVGDVVVYNEALTTQQIEDNYSAGYWGRLTGSGETLSGAAIDQAFDMAGWGQAVVVDTGDKYVAAGLIGDRKAADFVREVARSEDGLLFQARGGTIQFWDEGWQLDTSRGGTVRFSLTDGDPSGLPTPVVGYQTCDFTFDDSLLANSWDVEWSDGDTHAEDPASILEHGRYEQSVSTLLTTEGQAIDLANFRLWQRAQPKFEIGEVTFDALSSGDDGIEVIQSWCEIGARVRVVRTRPNGTTIDDEYHIVSVRHSIQPANGPWDVTLGLELADSPGSPFIVGTSEVDGPDVVWY